MKLIKWFLNKLRIHQMKRHALMPRIPDYTDYSIVDGKPEVKRG